MSEKTGNRKHLTRWMVATVVLVAVAGISGATIAKERGKQSATQSKNEKPGTESGNGYIGVYMQDLSTDVRKGLDLKVEKGVLVSGVEDDSPADKAGIKDGDVIVRYNGKSVSSPDDLRDAVRESTPGQTAQLDIVHDGDSKTLTLVVSERPEHHAYRWESHDGDSDAPMAFARAFSMMGGPRLGVQVHDLDDDGLAAYFGVKKGDGLLVLSVDDESVAGKAGVKPGDIISKVGNEKIEGAEDVHRALKSYDEGDRFDITVIRHGKTQSLGATMDKQEHEFAFDMPRGDAFRWHGAAPHMYKDSDRDDLRRDLDELKQQVQELKEQLEQRNDG